MEFILANKKSAGWLSPALPIRVAKKINWQVERVADRVAVALVRVGCPAREKVFDAALGLASVSLERS